MFQKLALSAVFVVLLTVSAVAQDQRLEGEVKNLLTGGADTVTMKLKTTDKGPLLTGEFGCNELFGRFALSGLVRDDDSGSTSYVFQGDLHLGNDGSSWEEGTTFPFAITICFEDGKITGVYSIGKNGNAYESTVPQMGTLDLRRVRR